MCLTLVLRLNSKWRDHIDLVEVKCSKTPVMQENLCWILEELVTVENNVPELRLFVVPCREWKWQFVCYRFLQSDWTRTPHHHHPHPLRKSQSQRSWDDSISRLPPTLSDCIDFCFLHICGSFTTFLAIMWNWLASQSNYQPSMIISKATFCRKIIPKIYCFRLG